MSFWNNLFLTCTNAKDQASSVRSAILFGLRRLWECCDSIRLLDCQRFVSVCEWILVLLLPGLSLTVSRELLKTTANECTKPVIYQFENEFQDDDVLASGAVTLVHAARVAQPSSGRSCLTFAEDSCFKFKKACRSDVQEAVEEREDEADDNHRGDNESSSAQQNHTSRLSSSRPKQHPGGITQDNSLRLERLSATEHRRDSTTYSSVRRQNSAGRPSTSGAISRHSAIPAVRLGRVRDDQTNSGQTSNSGVEPDSCRDASVSRNKCVAVIDVLVGGTCYCLPAIFHRIFGQSLPKPVENRFASKSRNRSALSIEMTQIFGSIERNRTVAWNHVEPMADVSHCIRMMDSTVTPKLLILPVAVCEDDLTSKCLQELLRCLSANSKESRLFVIIAHEHETDSNNDALIVDLLKRSLNEQSDNLWYWKQDCLLSDLHGSQAPLQESLTFLLEQAASASASKEFCTLEEAVLLERRRGQRTIDLKQLQCLASKSANVAEVSSLTEYLRIRGFVVRRPSTSTYTLEAQFPNNSFGSESFLVLNPLWFYRKINCVIDALIHQQSRREASMLEVARHKGFHLDSEVKKFVNLHMPDVSKTEQEVFLETAHNCGLMVDLREPEFIHEDATSGNFVTATNCKISDKTPNYRNSYFIPASLIPENLRPVEGQVVSSIALRSPGTSRTDVPIWVFYDIVSFLTRRFPLAVKCTQYVARFNPEPLHVLQLEYSEKGSCIECAMFVVTEDPTCDSTGTGTVCSSVRELIASRINDLNRVSSSVTKLRLQFAAMIETVEANGQRTVDFTDLYDFDVTSCGQLFSVGNQPFYPSPRFLLWYGGAPKTSLIQQNFLTLAEELDAAAAANWLFHRHTINVAELDDIVHSDPPSRASRLFLVLLKRGARGDTLLNDIMKNPSLKTKERQGQRNQLRGAFTDSGIERSASTSGSGSRYPPTPALGGQERLLSPLIENDRPTEESLITPTSDSSPDNNQAELESSQRRVAADSVGNGSVSVVNAPDRSVCSTKSDMMDTEIKPTNIAVTPTAKSSSDCSLSLTSNLEQASQPRGTAQPTTQSDKSSDGDNVHVHTVSSISKDQLAVPTSGLIAQITEHSLAMPRHTSSLQPEALCNQQAGAETPNALRRDDEQRYQMEEPQVHPIFEAKYYHVQRATDNFDDRPTRDGGKRLGSGSFGKVYYGILHSENGGKFEVAIKRLKKASSLNPSQVELSRKQFGTEMNFLTRYVHPNIVRLLGFSSDGPELCLLYEYMALGALSSRLDCKDKTPPIKWQFRLTIARDIAVALEFLHTQYKRPVIHRDVKSSNVLLGEKLEAKLSDFGLALLGGTDAEQESSIVSPGPSVGTRPYMPPEAFTGIVSPKVDVYGLGMILYELATGLPPYSSKKKQTLNEYIDNIEKQNVDMIKMLDPKGHWPKTRSSHERYPCGLELLDVAKLATRKDCTQRPDISTVTSRLKSLADRMERP